MRVGKGMVGKGMGEIGEALTGYGKGGGQRKNKGISINPTLTPLGHFCRGSEQSCRDIVRTSVWGCGRWRAAPVKSQAEQHTERWFI